MTPELTLLTWTLVLALVQIFAAAGARTRQYGAAWNTGPRDEVLPPLNPVAGRLVRAQANLFETLPLFIAAVLMAHVAGKEGGQTTLGAGLYLAGRLVYVPLYALGVPVVRSIAWGVALVGLLLILARLIGIA
ncbi:MAG TPA: MAPEG family protein [Caulobacteraceae bacterium]|jgi:uncharacterized MAPEG superfamily protein|nr:MAPEG family protein [Caulobacteraceae bacterium]